MLSTWLYPLKKSRNNERILHCTPLALGFSQCKSEGIYCYESCNCIFKFRLKDPRFYQAGNMMMTRKCYLMPQHALASISHSIHVRGNFEHLPSPVLCHVVCAIDVECLVRVHGDQHLADVRVDFVALKSVGNGKF